MKLEVCASDINSVIAAKRAGADRVELCSALEVGGLTPSYGLIEEAVRTGIKVNVLIRPRGGDFVYNEEEVRIMLSDIEMAVRLGVNAVVIGALKEDGSIDIPVCQRLMRAASNVEVTFHRAFDRCADWRKSLEKIIELGCNRVLTSGQKSTAIEGAETLNEIVRAASSRIIILAGSGVTSENVSELVRRTGVTEVHASAKRLVGGHIESNEEEIRRILAIIR